MKGPGVEEEDPVVEVDHGQRPPVRAEIGLPEQRVRRRVHDPDRFRRPLEGGKQVAARLRRVVDRSRLAGQEEREVEVLLDERLGAEALGELGRLGVTRLAALGHRVDPARDGRDEQERDPCEQRAEAPVRAPSLLRLLLRRLAALGDELALELVDVERVVGGPVERGREASTAEELALIAPGRVPLGRRLRDVTAKPAPFGVLLDPLAQAWPLAQQRLVGDLDRALADGDETAVGQRREHVGHPAVALEVELGERGAAAHRRVALALADQAQHEGADERLALVRDPVVRAFGEPRNGAVDTAGLAVGSQRERVVLPLLPELEQGGGQERQRARLALDVVDERVGQLRLDPQAHPGGGQLDGAAQLRGLHRPDQHVVRAQELGERRVRGEAAVEVRAQRDHDDGSAVGIGGRAGEDGCEGGALGLGSAGGEELLELVDGEEEPPVRGQRVESLGERILRPRHEHAAQLIQRPLAGAQQQTPPARATRQDASGERRKQAGAKHRRLAAARRADDAEEAGADEPGDELGDEPLAAEEVVGIHRLEARQTLERTDALGGDTSRRGRAGERACLLARELEVDHLAGQLGLDLAEVAPAGGCPGSDVEELAARLVDRDRERRPGELATTRVALLRLLRQRPGDHTVERGRQLGPLCARRRRLRVEVREDDCDLRVTPERRLPDEALVEHAAERVDVRAAVDLLTLDLLGSDVVDRAEQLAVLADTGLVGDPLRDAEVRQVDVVGAVRPGTRCRAARWRASRRDARGRAHAPHPGRSRPARGGRSRPRDPGGLRRRRAFRSRPST